MSRSVQPDPSRSDYERMANMLIDAAPTALYVFDLAGRSPVFVSPHGPALLGLDAVAVETLGPEFLRRTMHPDDWTRVAAHFDGFADAADGETREFEYRMRATDGSWRWFRSHDVVFARDPDGHPRQILGLGLDITEHKAAEGALRESEASFRRLANALPQFVWVTEPDGALSYVNERWTAFSGLDLAQTNDPAAMAALFHPDDRERVASAWSDAFASGGPLEIEARMLGRDGTYHWFLILGVSVANGNGARWFGTSTDVTAAKEDETRLERLQAATASLSAAATPADVHRVAMQTLVDLGARAGALYEVHGDDLVLVDQRGFDAAIIDQYRRIARTAPIPLADAARHATGVWIRSRQDYLDQYPHLAEKIAMLDTEAAVSLPLVVEGRVLGVLGLTFSEVRVLGSGEQRFLLTLAALTAQALERASAYTLARAANERFDRAEAAANAFSYAWDLETGHVERSAGLRGVLGYEPQELPPTWEAWAALLHPDDRRHTKAEAIAFLNAAGNEALGNEYRVRHKDGTYRWLSERATLIRDEAGRLRRVIGQTVDITEHKAAEAALRASEERYRDLLGRIDQGFCVFEMLYGPDGRANDYRFLEVNPTFARHTGLENVVGKTARELVPDLEDLWMQRYAEVAETGIPQRFEQGSEAMGRWFEVEAVRVGGEESRRVALLFADVTERKRAAVLLERRQREFEALAEHLPDVVARFDRALRHTYVNAAATAATGLHREAYVGRTNAELGFPPDLLHIWEERSHAAFATGEEQFLAFTYDGPDGARHYEARIVPERGADGEVETLLSVTTDVSNRLRFEQERTAFLDAIAHDVKNPLSVIKAQAQLARRRLQRGIVDSARLEASLKGIETAVDGAVTLIDELLDVAHVQAGRSLDLHPAPTDLVVLAQDAVAVAQGSTTSHRVWVSALVPALVGAWDEARLRRVLANLLSNAVKYSPEGGEVEVRVAQEDATGAWAVLSVRDQGIGIPAADLPHLFQRFRRGGNVSGIRGTGIGLASARHIVVQHGGTIVVESQEGIGSTITIRLPLAVPEAGAA